MEYSIPFQKYFRVSVSLFFLFFSCVSVFVSAKFPQAGRRGEVIYRLWMGAIGMHINQMD